MKNGTLKLAIPPGYVDARCLVCPADVVIPDGTLRCPNGEHDVEPTSLPRMVKSEVAAVVVAAAPVATAEAISLPNIRQAATWDRATEALLTALEHEEETALAAFEQARERVKTARRAAGALRQLRGLVSITRPAAASAPAPQRQPRSIGGWSRAHERCIVCGTTETKHASHGRCLTCASFWQLHKTERPRERSEAPAGA